MASREVNNRTDNIVMELQHITVHLEIHLSMRKFHFIQESTAIGSGIDPRLKWWFWVGPTELYTECLEKQKRYCMNCNPVFINVCRVDDQEFIFSYLEDCSVVVLAKRLKQKIASHRINILGTRLLRKGLSEGWGPSMFQAEVWQARCRDRNMQYLRVDCLCVCPSSHSWARHERKQSEAPQDLDLGLIKSKAQSSKQVQYVEKTVIGTVLRSFTLDNELF